MTCVQKYSNQPHRKHFYNNSIINKNRISIKIGCDCSLLQDNSCNQNLAYSAQTLADQQVFKIDIQKFIQRERGQILSFYHFSKVIYRGNTVIRKVLERNSRITRICKMKSVRNQEHFLSAFQQVQILKNLNHPNIVQIIQYFIEHNYLYIVMEDIPGKTFCEMLCQGQLSKFSVIVDIMKQLMIALKFCHQRGYAHKAINPRHVVICKLENSNSFLVKLTGFGNSQKLGTQKNTKLFSQNNQEIYIAPQIQNSKNVQKFDIWACGTIFLNLLTGQEISNDFLAHKNEIIEESISNTNLSAQRKQIVLDFLKNTLQIDPNKRISAQQALLHPLFQIKGRSQTLFRQKQANVIDRLLKFRVGSTLISLFPIYATLNILTVQEKAEHLLEFYNLDKNKDGKIDFNEIVECTQNTYNIERSLAIQHVKKIFSGSNKSEQCSLQFNEYLSATTFMKKEVFERSLCKIFEEIDIDKDKTISKDELQRAVGVSDLSQIFKEYEFKDLNFCNFKNLMLKMFEKTQFNNRQSDLQLFIF